MVTPYWSIRLLYTSCVLCLLLVILLAGARTVGAQIEAAELYYSRPVRSYGYPNIYALDVGRGLTRLFLRDTDPFSLAWSPDGQHIAYASDPNGRGLEIYVMTAEGRDARRLTVSETSNHSPRWTPDGQSIIFTGSAALVPQRWSIVDVPDGWVRAHPMDLLVDPRMGRAWTAAGDRVAFVMRQYERLIDEILVLETACFADLKTCPRTRLDPGPAANYGVANLNWSPDGRWLAFSALTQGTENRDLFLIDPQVSGARRLTTSSAVDVVPLWSPDGRWLAFLSNRTGTFQIFSIDMTLCASGDCEAYVRQLTDGPSRNIHPAWSPDGAMIAFVSERDGNSEIYLMNADGSDQRRLTYDPFDNQAPRWRP
ncbi:MAG TPA: hypothetical protein VKY59_14535 [Spirillospora sp.]|nr:hypothetical protein [Spirillospora sp.]